MEIDQLKEFVQQNNRVCPMSSKWQELWEMLPNKSQKSSGGWEPALPLILGAWHETSNMQKMLRLGKHINWAEENGFLEEVIRFLKGLDEVDWHHISE